MRYDVIVIGAGPGGIFSVYELLQRKPELKIAVFEAGHALSKRSCPIDGKKIKSCIGCKSCSIMSGFVTPTDASTVPDVMLSYEDINALERNLYLLKQLLDAMVGSFIKSGTYKSGATTRLPIRR